MYEEEQRGYYILSSFWAELENDQVLGEPATVRTFDMHTCTLEDVQVTACLPQRNITVAKRRFAHLFPSPDPRQRYSSIYIQLKVQALSTKYMNAVVTTLCARRVLPDVGLVAFCPRA